MRKEIYLLRVAGFFLVFVLVMLHTTLAAQVRPEAAPFTVRQAGFGTEAVVEWPTVITQQKGFFAKEGLTVSMNRSYEMMQALIGGSFDVIDEGAEIFLLAAKGADIVIVHELSRKPPHYMVLGKGINSAKELEGKQVGVSRMPSLETMLLKEFFAKTGVDANKVAFARIGGSRDRLTALQTGAIPGTVLSAEWAYFAQREGMKMLATPRDWRAFPTTLVVLRKQWAAANPDVVVKYVRSIHRATKWLYEESNFEEAVQLISQANKTDAEAVRWILQVALKEKFYNLEKPSASSLQLGADWLLSEKILTKPFNAATIVDTRYYEQAIK